MRGIGELDHYDLLEIARNARPAEIDRAYRTAQQTYAEGSLALYSIFENLDARAIREQIDDAYRVLADPELRAEYDAVLIAETSPASMAETGMPSSEAAFFGPDGFVESSAVPAYEAAGATSAADSQDDFVEEYDALEDDGRGEFDGVRLRRNRLFRGYEIEDISDVTKVSGAHLRNIEDENFRDLPADVYVRGFVTAYAQTIGLDPKIVVPSYMARVQESRCDNQPSRFLGRH